MKILNICAIVTLVALHLFLDHCPHRRYRLAAETRLVEREEILALFL